MSSLAHQCPYCDLRFTHLTEVKDHILHDHEEHAAVVELLDPHELPHVEGRGPMSIGAGHQCPWCELRFAFVNELRDHVRLDHEPQRADSAPIG
jgi:hypothetical protein